ncbi:hypothetical protein LSH36_148g03024 [Paralvinella palmiformis]|uniref:Homeobox domain-containing protein n=1 Tax=Paralvinella palmiformis TaxID=53620 RepID=A0AAD9JV20_9ANNE|nr:hypothetical protein LSH36_148g03024 [Paralvinella palmiformis]
MGGELFGRCPPGGADRKRRPAHRAIRNDPELTPLAPLMRKSGASGAHSRCVFDCLSIKRLSNFSCHRLWQLITSDRVCNENSNSSTNGNSRNSEGSGSGGRSRGHKEQKTTRVRTVLNEKQLHTLRTCYGANPRPDALMKEQLVEMTGLSPRVIRVWFQNKRCKDKKRSIMMKQLQQQQQEKVNSRRYVSRTVNLAYADLSFYRPTRFTVGERSAPGRL